ncbi:DNA processing protein DprA [Methylobacterium nonmethylotrophicum]|uniref:DNA processing protein DprA n=1 Tax=Methylobacterium nonmethylotrophicum TaxID=1141884 RepID=A0A4Z0NWU3_9HYPH|nr:DNA processing protein DprA [Methylobacterium nonmethylotrophicum]
MEILARPKSAEPALRASGVAALTLFGSHARDEARDDSDIDVFVDPAPGVAFGLPSFMAAYEVIEAAAGAQEASRLDCGTRSGLHPLLRPRIERDAVRVF